MVIRMGAGAAVSRLVFITPVGVKFTLTADLAEAGIWLRPLYCYPSGQNKPSDDIHNQNQPEHHQAGGPCLTVPVFIGGNGVNIDHMRQGLDGLVEARAPITIAERGEQ